MKTSESYVMRVARRYPLWIRLAVFGLLAVAGISLPLALYMWEANKAIDFVRQERSGIPLVDAGLDAIDALGAHRRSVYQMVAGEAGAAAELPKRTSEADAAMSKFATALRAQNISKAFREALDQTMESWGALKQRPLKTVNPAVAARYYGALVDGMIALLELTADHYSLSLDPEPETYYLIIGVTQQLPRLSEQVANLRTASLIAAMKESPSSAEIGRIYDFAGQVESAVRQMRRAVEKAFQASDASKQSMGALLDNLEQRVLKTLDVSRAVAGGAKVEGGPIQLQHDVTELIVLQRKISETALNEINRMLTERERSTTGQLRWMVAIVVAVFVLFVVVGALVFRSIHRPLRELLDAADAVREGAFERVNLVPAGDEVGRVAQAFTSMKGTLEEFARAQGEMAREQSLGNTSHRIDAGRFEGTYGKLAGQVNALVEEQLKVTEQLVQVVGRYGQGDFSVEMPALPGDRMQLTQAANDVKASLTAISEEIKRLAVAASHGDFTARGDGQRFGFAYREIVDELNRLMEAAQTGLDDANRMFRSLAAGDLTARVDSTLQGAFAELRENANATMEQLGTLIRDIGLAASELQTAATEITSGNQDLSGRTEGQASGLEQTASSMEELTSTVRKNAESANQASALAASASAIARKGGTTVEQIVTTMGSITEGATRVSDITAVIDGIAFQTNILALNAAVEAARAGPQGKGFAVVASEVRSLAQRSATAAKEIKVLIGESMSSVEAGGALVRNAGTEMNEIVGSIQRVNSIIEDIARSSAEQSAGIEQINQAIGDMDRTTQQNAALVEETAAAAESMEQGVGSLVRACSKFRLAGGAGKSGTNTSAARATSRAASTAAPRLQRSA